jgi:hypothetical protein
MTDEPDKTSSTDSAEPATERDAPRAAAPLRTDDKSPSPNSEIKDAGTIPAPPLTAATAPPTPESQAAPQAKAPSGQSSSGMAMPAAPADETPEQKRARIIAEAKAKAAAKAAGGAPSANASAATSDEEKAARIAEARAKAAALKQTAGEPGATATTASAPPTATAAGVPKAPVKKKDEGPKPIDAASHPLVARVRDNLDGAFVEASEFLGQLSIRVAPARVVEVCEFLKSDAQTPFNYLSDLTCVHYPKTPPRPSRSSITSTRSAQTRVCV